VFSPDRREKRFRGGYFLNGKLLRPALVVVAQ
jgi:molecular chaperone GrpE (heat shock protein)